MGHRLKATTYTIPIVASREYVKMCVASTHPPVEYGELCLLAMHADVSLVVWHPYRCVLRWGLLAACDAIITLIICLW